MMLYKKIRIVQLNLTVNQICMYNILPIIVFF